MKKSLKFKWLVFSLTGLFVLLLALFFFLPENRKQKEPSSPKDKERERERERDKTSLKNHWQNHFRHAKVIQKQ